MGPRRTFLATALAVLCALASPGALAGATSQHRTTPHPYRVAFFGDSFGYQAAPYLAADLEATHHIAVTLGAWPGGTMCAALPQIASTVAKVHPDVVVIQYYGTAFFACAQHAPWASPAWIADYKRNTVQAVKTILAGERHAFVILTDAPANLPPPAPDERARIKDAYREVAAEFPGRVIYVDAGRSVEHQDGTWAASLPCTHREITKGRCSGPFVSEVNGVRSIRVRADNTVHFCPLLDSAGTIPPPGCPSYSSGAYRFARAMAIPVIKHLKLSPQPDP